MEKGGCAYANLTDLGLATHASATGRLGQPVKCKEARSLPTEPPSSARRGIVKQRLEQPQAGIDVAKVISHITPVTSDIRRDSSGVSGRWPPAMAAAFSRSTWQASCSQTLGHPKTGRFMQCQTP
jgi:hypothetical protein